MCGIVGILGSEDSPYYTLLALHAIQHRGHEGVGIAWFENGTILPERRVGLVSDLAKKFPKVKSHVAIGHVHYSTTGRSEARNLQPFVINGMNLKLAVCHNGNIVNFLSLRRMRENEGSVFTTDSDTEVIPHLIASSKGDIVARIKTALSMVKGAYSLVMMTQDSLIAVRDPWGFRPLVLGKFRNLKNAYIVASETCALDIVDSEFIREIEPGEILVISRDKIYSERLKPADKRECIFELIYFSRPDSHIFGVDVWSVRIMLGRILAQEQPADADIVVPVPDSGLFSSIGYSEESKIPFAYGLVRNHYIGRTFIEPSAKERISEVSIKLNPIKGVVSGKRVVLVDDSIVRGTTSRKIVKMLKDAGAREVHLRISSPPIRYPCYYGIDTPSEGELIASSHSIEEIRNFIGCDSLGYISVDGMLKAVKLVDSSADGFCTACFTGRYPVPPEDAEFIKQLRLFRDDI